MSAEITFAPDFFKESEIQPFPAGMSNIFLFLIPLPKEIHNIRDNDGHIIGCVSYVTIF